MLKTINDLNEKMWYRLLKIIHILILSFLIFVSMIIIFVCYKPPYNLLSKEDLLKKMELSFAVEDVVFFIDTDPTTFKSITKDIDTIREAGGGQYDMGKYLQEVAAVPFTKSSQYRVIKFSDKNSIEKMGQIIKRLNPEYKNYSNYEIGKRVYIKFLEPLEYKDSVPIAWLKVITYSIIWCAIWLSFFEIIKRLFYYVVLGKLFPPRNKE